MEKIIERIRKLLALASNNSSEHEREAALAKAHAMLLEHNLAMSDVAGQEEVEEEIAANTVSYKFTAQPWSRWIASAIAELYFCKFYWSKKMPSQTVIITFVGTKADAEIAHAVANMVLTSVWQGALLASRQQVATTPAKARLDFASAAAKTIYWRCKALRQAAERGETAESDGRALVVASIYQKKLDAAQSWMNEHVTLNKPRKTVTVNRYSAAAEAGRAHGEKVQLTMSLPKR